ncbi:unnamed protein product [Hymenolepis diminuta]|uniref:Uncharacterized protein n=1 Tax=Hymenolepis diminuta TaxID=6216 RepID=A0A564Z3R4_HYMDI|nr:unnamed protein product [Hymenolepis diminuta]
MKIAKSSQEQYNTYFWTRGRTFLKSSSLIPRKFEDQIFRIEITELILAFECLSLRLVRLRRFSDSKCVIIHGNSSLNLAAGSLLRCFLDRYRDLSDKDVEVFLMQLANEGKQLNHLCTQPEFSLINSRLPTNCGVPSWWRQQEIQRRLGRKNVEPNWRVIKTD